jgi:L-2,4-diaminobutyrate decarboxylase
MLAIPRSRQLIDPAFVADSEALNQALALLLARGQVGDKAALPTSLPDTGIGEAAPLRQLAPVVLGGARRLDGGFAMAHIDPPTPWITWATTLWNASLNQRCRVKAKAMTAVKTDAKTASSQHLGCPFVPFRPLGHGDGGRQA